MYLCRVNRNFSAFLDWYMESFRVGLISVRASDQVMHSSEVGTLSSLAFVVSVTVVVVVDCQGSAALVCSIFAGPLPLHFESALH